MNHPHLYVKSLLNEIQEINKKMMQTHSELERSLITGFAYHDTDNSNRIKKIESYSLEIEQLNQEIVNTLKDMETK